MRFQFRFRIPGEQVCIVRPPQTSPTLYLNWSAASGPQLECSKTYEVDVRVSKDRGATWCVDSPKPGLRPEPGRRWGRMCTVTIDCVHLAVQDQQQLATNSNGNLTMYPNPNNGDQLFITL